MIKMNLHCCYTRHPCSRFRYRDYRFCFQHILEDKSAPFVACQYISNTTNRRCHNPALKTDSSHSTITLCEVHQQRNSSIADQVSRKRTKKSCHTSRLDSSPIGKCKKFKKTKYEKTDAVHDSLNYTSEMADDSYEYDADANSRWLTAKSPSWKGGEPDIDADSTDEDENQLKNAGVYTFEEVVSNSRHCLVKLQSLYVKQFKQLNRKLQAKRREYMLHMNHGHTSARGNSKKGIVEDTEKKAELQALLSYRRHSKTSILLQRQAKRRRIDLSKGSNVASIEPAVNKTRCSLVSNHTRCKSTSLPYTKYCTMHILEDPLQMLYKKCAFDSCKTPVCTLPYAVKRKGEDLTLFCPMHETFGPISDGLLASMKKIEAFNSKSITSDASCNDDVVVVPEEEAKSPFCEAEPAPQPKPEGTILQDKADTEASSDNQILDSATDQVPLSVENEMERPLLLTIDEDQIKPDVSQTDDVLRQNPNQDDKPSAVTLNKIDISKPNEPPTSDITLLKTGQCYVLSQVSLCDGDGPPKTPALQLQPVGSSSQTLLVKALPQVQNTQESGFDLPREQGAVLHVKPGDEKSSSSHAELHHQGSIMTVSSNFQSADKQHQFNVETSKVSTSAILIPPVETGSNQTADDTRLKTAHDCDKEKKDSDEMVAAVRYPMPPTEPIASFSGVALEDKILSPSDNMATPKPELLPSKENTSTLEENTTSTPVAVLDIPPLEALKSNSLPLSSNLDSADSTPTDVPAKDCNALEKVITSKDTPLLTESLSGPDILWKGSEDSIHSSRDNDVAQTENDVLTSSSFALRNTSSESDRKPSSADEEAAIASLLSLSTGAAASNKT